MYLLHAHMIGRCESLQWMRLIFMYSTAHPCARICVHFESSSSNKYLAINRGIFAHGLLHWPPRSLLHMSDYYRLYWPSICLSVIVYWGVRSKTFGKEISQWRWTSAPWKGQFVSKGLVVVAEFLQANPHCSVIVFCNSRKQSQHFAKEFEKKPDHIRLSVDVININGLLDKIDKFWCIRLFCDNRHTQHGQFRALVTTNALNVGIDKHSVALQVTFEWPRDLLRYFQERGRGSRCQSEPSTCIAYGDLPSNVYLRIQLFNVGNNVEDNVTSSTLDGDVYNLAISSRKQGQALPKKKTYPLSITARQTLHLRTQTELHEVIRFFCLGLGCQHARGESYLSTGALAHSRMDYEGCNTSCPICTKRVEWSLK